MNFDCRLKKTDATRLNTPANSFREAKRLLAFPLLFEFRRQPERKKRRELLSLVSWKESSSLSRLEIMLTYINERVETFSTLRLNYVAFTGMNVDILAWFRLFFQKRRFSGRERNDEAAASPPYRVGKRTRQQQYATLLEIYPFNQITDKRRSRDWSINVCRISLQNASPARGRSLTFSRFSHHRRSGIFLSLSRYRYYVNEPFQINKQHRTQSSPCGNTCAVIWADAKWPTLPHSTNFINIVCLFAACHPDYHREREIIIMII